MHAAGNAQPTWIEFRRSAPDPKKVTAAWVVVPNGGGALLGQVKWYAPWRCYAFFPESGTVFERACLERIAGFCFQETRSHRWKRQQEREARA